MATTKSANLVSIRLQELAFEVFFEKIVHNSTPNTVQFVQDLINAHLVGRVKNAIRFYFIYFQFVLVTVKYIFILFLGGNVSRR